MKSTIGIELQVFTVEMAVAQLASAYSYISGYTNFKVVMVAPSGPGPVSDGEQMQTAV